MCITCMAMRRKEGRKGKGSRAGRERGVKGRRLKRKGGVKGKKVKGGED